jgi:hypothetical protein
MSPAAAALVRGGRLDRQLSAPRDQLRRRDPEAGRAHQIRAHEREQLHATISFSSSIVGVERLTNGIGFSSYAVREGFVLHGVSMRGLKFIPQALDECQSLEDVVGRRTGSHARGVSADMAKGKVGLSTTRTDQPDVCGGRLAGR